jgi:pentafunctional AROM polypeptide
MVDVLRKAGADGSNRTSSALVVGGGGTARAAIYALWSMGYSPIFLIGRSPEKLQILAKSFPEKYNLQILPTEESVNKVCRPVPHIAISTIPADQPLDDGLRRILTQVLTLGRGAAAGTSIFLEMAYKPRDTPVRMVADTIGWRTVDGLEVLVAQGVYQFQYWTGIMPLYEFARVSYFRSHL